MIDILDLLEFQVLAAARNIDSYYGFSREKAAAKEEVYYTVYLMARSGILKQEKEGLIIQPPFSGYLDEIKNSSCVLVIDRGGYILPRQCIYFGGGQYVCLEYCCTDQERIGVCGMGEEEFFLQLKELDQLAEPRLAEGSGQFDFPKYWENHLSERLKEMPEDEEDREEYPKDDQVHSVFTLRSKETGRIFARMILAALPLEYCMIVKKAGEPASREPYTREKAWEILKAWWRNKG